MALKDQFDPQHAATPLIAENRQRHLDLAEWISSVVADKDQAIRDHMRTACHGFLLTSCHNFEDYLATLPAPVPEPEPILPGPDLSAERLASLEINSALLDSPELEVEESVMRQHRGKKRQR